MNEIFKVALSLTLSGSLLILILLLFMPLYKNKFSKSWQYYNSSPLLLGFFRPCIMLPTDDLSDSDFQYTILHELIHFKQQDIIYKWLFQIILCLHWFNQIIYLMGQEINRACKLACDEIIIS